MELPFDPVISLLELTLRILKHRFKRTYAPLPPTCNPPSPPLCLSMGPLYMYLEASPSFPCYPHPLWSLSVCSSFPCSILLTCLFCWLCSTYVPLRFHVIGEITWCLSFIAWLISLTIIFSSSIHAVAKGRSSMLSFCCIEFHCVNVPVFWSTHLLMDT